LLPGWKLLVWLKEDGQVQQIHVEHCALNNTQRTEEAMKEES